MITLRTGDTALVLIPFFLIFHIIKQQRDATGDDVKKIVRRVKFVDYGRFGLSAYSLRMRARSLGLLNRLKKKKG
ncbi:hypothetical protein CHH79_02855 [Bacillus siamensis]|nr:hypothetical protein CHH79_02855 [Bacillus siamensis]